MDKLSERMRTINGRYRPTSILSEETWTVWSRELSDWAAQAEALEQKVAALEQENRELRADRLWTHITETGGDHECPMQSK